MYDRKNYLEYKKYLRRQSPIEPVLYLVYCVSDFSAGPVKINEAYLML
uniref:Uncharacterized protein n=1 Tax=Arundo donax TaxID=35708 RepID=A0A0A9FRY3_ARUDO